MARKEITILIGRFSPFHNGHASVLRRALETSELVIVLVGSCGAARNTKNPFNFDERQSIITNWHATQRFDAGRGAALLILPIRDYLYNDAMWIRQVQSTVKSVVSTYNKNWNSNLKKVFLTGSNRDSSTWYLDAFPQWELDLVEPYSQDDSPNISATEVRDRLFAGRNSNVGLSHTDDPFELRSIVPEATSNFLSRFEGTQVYRDLCDEHKFLKKYKDAWKDAPYPPTFVTSDAVVIQSGHILVIERANMPGRGLWALPGGFLNQGELFKQGAIRELVEETGLSLAEGKRAAELTKQILNGSIRDKGVFDHPDRSLRGRTITTAFLFRLDDTKPLPKVKGMDVPAYEANGQKTAETADAFWLPISEALENTDRWFEDHLDIVLWGIQRA